MVPEVREIDEARCIVRTDAVDHTGPGQRGPARCLLIDRIDILVTDLDPRDSCLHARCRRFKVL
jgi:hypothetical protein